MFSATCWICPEHVLEGHARNVGLYSTGNEESLKSLNQGIETQVDLNFRMTLEFLKWGTEWMEILFIDLCLPCSNIFDSSLLTTLILTMESGCVLEYS